MSSNEVPSVSLIKKISTEVLKFFKIKKQELAICFEDALKIKNNL